MTDYALPAGCLGLVIGSFLNVVIYRLPSRQSIVYPGSHCPHCRRPLAARDLIPLLNYFILGGQCRYCAARIPIRYPLVEALTGIAFFLTAHQAADGITLRLMTDLIFVAGLIALSFIDIDTGRLPDRIVLPLLGFGLAAALLIQGRPDAGEALLSAAVAGGGFALIAWAYPQGLGWGDVKLIAAIGAFLGFPKILLAILIGSLSGVLIGVICIVWRQRKVRQSMPFGPYLTWGALCALFWGQSLLELYWG
ncbi:MAG: prepilin peptidase [Peptococcaceae bacterium]|nr:prepilin peptidase [Peptococcaceae bacterium]